MSNEQRATSNVQRATEVLIYVQPRAAVTAVAGRHGAAIKIRVAAPPVDGDANAELVRFLARHLGVRRSDVAIVGGLTSRTKRVRIAGMEAAAVSRRLLATV